MRIEDEKGNTAKQVGLAIGAAIFIIVILLIIVLLLHWKDISYRPILSSSSEEPSTSEEISSSEEESSTSEYDPYIDEAIVNIKKYIKTVGNDVLGSSLTVKDIYAVNTYVESETTHVVYGFITDEEDDKYIRFDIDLEAELDIDAVISLIHEDKITVDMFVGNDLYEIVEDDITNKSSFKEVYPGTYTHHLCYKDDMEQYYMSGIGVNDDRYISIDHLMFDNTTYDIDNTDTHINQTSDVSGRHWELLESLV